MIRCNSFLGRSVAILCSLALINMAIPMGVPKLIADALPKPPPVTRAGAEQTSKRSKPLTAKEMRIDQGKYGKNPYMAGSGKWDPQYKGVNLVTHNFSTSATDMSFEGGYGIPVNITRSYSANSGEEGPFGEGWALSADVRTTAGGLLKSSGAPIRSVPTNFKNRPSAQTIDPNLPSTGQPVEAMTAADASGKEETLQRDVDGTVTAPAWDTNVVDNTYVKYVDGSGTEWQLVDTSKVTTVDGTVYEYSNEGFYCNSSGTMTGELPFQSTSGTPEPSYVLKITKATDRQGNETDYVYKSGTGTANQALFLKQNGYTLEQKLDHVQMPNGHRINFTWGTNSSGDAYTPTNRVRSVDDNVSGGRSVIYTYTSGLLTSVANPSGLVTSYGYGSATAPSGTLSTDIATDLLTTITDCRGLVTTIHYMMDNVYPLPYCGATWGPCVYHIEEPNGVQDYFDSYDYATMPSDFGTYPSYYTTANFFSRAGSGTGEVLNEGQVSGGDLGDGTCIVRMRDYTMLPESSPSLWRQWLKTYDNATENLVTSELDTYGRAASRYNTVDTDRFGSGYFVDQPFTKLITTTSYNFMGNPLNVDLLEVFDASGFPTYADKLTQYAYWDSTKYFQQKSVRTKTGSSSWRYSYTDYFDNTAGAGSKGQTRYVYDPKYGGVYLDTGATVPSGTPSGEEWRYQVAAPASGYSYSATFAYDSMGRATDVYKLQKTSPSYTYVRTKTTYGADTDGSWGQPNEVVEDYGGIGRTTQTLHYTDWGQADKVEDAAGHVFQTYYEPDGRIDRVTQWISGTESNVVEYTYGSSSGVTNGQVTNVVDDLSGVSQAFTYQSASGGGIGQVAQTTETNGSSSYSTSYSYNAAGEREYALYSTPNGDSKWWYHDYVDVGMPEGGKRAFQTLTKMAPSGGSWVASSEEMHYAYDGAGRVHVAAFAQTPTATSVLSNGTYYDASHLPSSRARAVYIYDPSGRLMSLKHYWDYPDGSGGYQTDALVGNTCTYTDYLGLKDTSTFLIQNPSNVHAFSTDHVEDYGYDSALDYLTSASYDGGSTTTTWSYDAAGNRNDASVVDNLNRATTISSVSRTYDILGNTTAIGSTKSMTWDALNRMASFTSGSTSTNYAYRSDGMRVSKASGVQTVRYAYDGQMPMEEALVDTSTSTNNYVTRYGLGARGLDRMETVNSSGTSVTYPLYDSHGNMVATVSKAPADACSVGNFRLYGAWGELLPGSATGGPTARHCATLGHFRDDESGLTYMRARYCDTSSGRFVSEDLSGQGLNWYGYCGNNPVSRSDSSGRAWLWDVDQLLENAWSIFQDSHWGSGTVETRQKLLRIIEMLRDESKAAAREGEQLISDGEADQEVAAGMGGASILEQKIGEIKQGIGSMSMASGVAAQLAMACIRIMLELLKQMETDNPPWDWFNR